MLAKDQSLHAGRQGLWPSNAETGTSFAGNLPFKLGFQISLAIWLLLPPFSNTISSRVLTPLSYRRYWRLPCCSYQSHQLAQVLCLRALWPLPPFRPFPLVCRGRAAMIQSLGIKDCPAGLLCSSRDTPCQGLGNSPSHSSSEVTQPCRRATTQSALHLPVPSPLADSGPWRRSSRWEGPGNQPRTGCTCFSHRRALQFCILTFTEVLPSLQIESD